MNQCNELMTKVFVEQPLASPGSAKYMPDLLLFVFKIIVMDLIFFFFLLCGNDIFWQFVKKKIVDI